MSRREHLDAAAFTVKTVGTITLIAGGLVALFVLAVLVPPAFFALVGFVWLGVIYRVGLHESRKNRRENQVELTENL